MAAGWFYSPSQIIRYLLTRVSSLKPPQVSYCAKQLPGRWLIHLEQIEKPIPYPKGTEPPPMAHVQRRILGVDLGCL